MPSVILANVGTPLIWVTLFHLVLGNIFIGILEGALLASLYRISSGRAVFLMILANYFSAWVGLVYLSLIVESKNFSLYDAPGVIWGMIAVAYVTTILLEWPFVLACFWRVDKALRRSVGASILVQSVSYVLLFGFYWAVSVRSLSTELTVVRPSEIASSAAVRIFYIADEDGNVYSRNLGTGQTKQVYALKSQDFKDCLSFQASTSEAGFHEIVALLDSGDHNEPNVVRIDIAVPDENCPLMTNGKPLTEYRWQSPSSGVAAKLGSAVESPWDFKAGFWPLQGLSGENTKTDDSVRFAIETPFVRWNVRRAIQLPADQILFQLGKSQICLLDLKERKVAVLCFGHGAVAVLDTDTRDP